MLKEYEDKLQKNEGSNEKEDEEKRLVVKIACESSTEVKEWMERDIHPSHSGAYVKINRCGEREQRTDTPLQYISTHYLGVVRSALSPRTKTITARTGRLDVNT